MGLGTSLKVKEVRSIGKGYVGMNPLAGKALGVKCPRNTILIKQSLSDAQKRSTVVHELSEYKLMKQGKSYDTAHKMATGLEKARKRRRR